MRLGHGFPKYKDVIILGVMVQRYVFLTHGEINYLL